MNFEDMPIPAHFNFEVAYEIHQFYISSTLEDPIQYTQLIHTLRSAGPDDKIVIYLNTPGGDISAGMQIINAMQSCQGSVSTVLDGDVCSMGALIFLAGSNHYVSPYSRMMLHNYSTGSFGKAHEVHSHLDSTSVMFTDMLTKLCKNFLTKAEQKQIIGGMDFWLTSDQVKARLFK